MTFFSSEFINTRALIRFEIWRQSHGDFFRDNAKWLEKYLDPDFVKNTAKIREKIWLTENYLTND